MKEILPKFRITFFSVGKNGANCHLLKLIERNPHPFGDNASLISTHVMMTTATRYNLTRLFTLNKDSPSAKQHYLKWISDRT